MNQASYKSGWDAYETALKNAYTTLGTNKVTASQVSSAVTSLNNAYNALVRYAVVITNHHYYTGNDDQNPVQIAKKFEEEAMTGRERKAYLDSLWDAEDSVYKIYYSSPYIFKRMIDIEMDKLEGYMETDYAAPQTKAELRELEDLPLEEIINRYPNVGIPLKMRVFDKARNADGNYV